LLIIFDLDDTLIKTSELITPWRFRKVLEHLQKFCPQQGFVQAFAELLNDHQNFESSEQALKTVLGKNGCDSTLLETAICEMNRFDEEIPVELFQSVKKLLTILRQKQALALVTSGNYQIQTLKIEKSGIKDFFDYIEIATSNNKKNIYQNLLQLSKNERAIVIGDRVSRDLLPAKELGLLTVLIRQGRGCYQKIDPNVVDYVIDDVIELQDLLKLAATT